MTGSNPANKKKKNKTKKNMSLQVNFTFISSDQTYVWLYVLLISTN